MRIRTRRRRERDQEQPPEVEPEVVGARTPGVMQRRVLTRREPDLNERIRDRLEARRGLGRPPARELLTRRDVGEPDSGRSRKFHANGCAIWF